MYVMIDVVANHMGAGAISDNRPAPLNQASSYHPACVINYSNQTSVEECRIAGLPDLNTQSTEIRTLFNTWIKWLVKEYSFDGVRIDTVKHVQKDFWPDFVSAAGVYSIGEVWDGDANYLVPYAKLMPGLLNYDTYYPMNRFYQQTGSAQALVDEMNVVSQKFPDPTALGTFLDNHDNERWLSIKNDQTLITNALAFVILSRGIPILYYGTEQGYNGGQDPNNREDLWRSKYKTDTPLYQAIKKLSGARKSAGGLAGNDHTHLYVTSNAYAWSRVGGNLIVLTTNAGSGSNAQHCFNSQKANGKWTDVFSGSSTIVSADGNGQVCVTLKNGNPIVLVATSASTPTTLRTSAAPASTCASTVSVKFTERVVTSIGETIKIAGSTAQLGNWLPANAPSLSASAYTASNPVWTITLPLAAGSVVEFKYVKVSSAGAITWESDPNRAYTVPKCQASAVVDNVRQQ
jgi:alpha-amylase